MSNELKNYYITLTIGPIKAHNGRWSIKKLNKLVKSKDFKVDRYIKQMFEAECYITEDGHLMYEYKRCIYG